MVYDTNISFQGQSHGLSGLEIDFNDASLFSQAIYSPNDIEYVVDGLQFTPNFNNNTLSVSGGWAKIYKPKNITLDHRDDQGVGQGPKVLKDACHPVQVSGEDNIILDAGDLNHIWLEIDLSQSNSYNIFSNTTDKKPELPHLKLGTVDTINKTYDDTVNRLPNGEYNDLKATTASVEKEPTDPTDVFRLQDYNPPEDTRTNVSDSAGVVVSETKDITFEATGASTVSVIDDEDGSATIEVDSVDTDTDTHTDVSEDGNQVSQSVSDINFTGSSSVSGDGDGSVTVSTIDTDTNTQVNVSDDGTQTTVDTENINFGSNANVIDNGDGTVTIETKDTDTHTGVSDSNSAVIESTEDINFGTALKVKEDGDGTVTIDGSDIHTDTNTHTAVSDDGSIVVQEVDDINFGENIGLQNDGDNQVTVKTSDNTIQSSVEAASNPLSIDISGDANTLDGSGEEAFAKLVQSENVTGNWTFTQKPFFEGGIEIQSDEDNFTIDEEVNYFGSPHNATRFRMHDSTGNYDGGYLFDYTNGSGDVKELLTLRTSNNSKNFHYNGNEIWHAGNDGSGSGLNADRIDGKHLSDLDNRYIDGGELNDHASYANIHHQRYDNDEARSAVASGTIPGRITATENDGTLVISPGSGNGDVPLIRPKPASGGGGSGKDIQFEGSVDEWNIEGNPRADGSPILTEADESALSVNYADQAGNADTLGGTNEGDFAKRNQDENVYGSWNFHNGIEFPGNSDIRLNDNSISGIEQLSFSGDPDVEASLRFSPANGQKVLVQDTINNRALSISDKRTVVQAINNPNENIFEVRSAGGALRLGVGQDEVVRTENRFMQVALGGSASGGGYLFGKGPASLQHLSGGVTAYDDANNSNRLI